MTKIIACFLQLLAKLRAKKQHPTIMDAPEPLHPFVRAALEKERRETILRNLRRFYRQRPRPWRAHQAYHRKAAR